MIDTKNITDYKDYVGVNLYDTDLIERPTTSNSKILRYKKDGILHCNSFCDCKKLKSYDITRQDNEFLKFENSFTISISNDSLCVTNKLLLKCSECSFVFVEKHNYNFIKFSFNNISSESIDDIVNLFNKTLNKEDGIDEPCSIDELILFIDALIDANNNANEPFILSIEKSKSNKKASTIYDTRMDYIYINIGKVKGKGKEKSKTINRNKSDKLFDFIKNYNYRKKLNNHIYNLKYNDVVSYNAFNVSESSAISIFYNKDKGKIKITNIINKWNMFNFKHTSKKDYIIINLKSGQSYIVNSLNYNGDNSSRRNKACTRNITYSEFNFNNFIKNSPLGVENLYKVLNLIIKDYKESNGLKIYNFEEKYSQLRSPLLFNRYGNFALEYPVIIDNIRPSNSSNYNSSTLCNKVVKELRSLNPLENITSKAIKNIGFNVNLDEVCVGTRISAANYILMSSYIFKNNKEVIDYYEGSKTLNIVIDMYYSYLFLTYDLSRLLKKDFTSTLATVRKYFIEYDEKYDKNSNKRHNTYYMLKDSISMYKELKPFINKKKIEFKFRLKSIKWTHDTLQSIQIQKDIEDKDKNKPLIYEDIYKKKFNKSYESLNFSLAKQTMDLVIAGKEMIICVGSYVNDALKGYCNIIIAKHNDKPIICIEINKAFTKVVQFKFYRNSNLSKLNTIVNLYKDGLLFDVLDYLEHISNHILFDTYDLIRFSTANSLYDIDDISDISESNSISTSDLELIKEKINTIIKNNKKFKEEKEKKDIILDEVAAANHLDDREEQMPF